METLPLWDAPLADRPVLADVRVPASKSMTNRALVLAALADGPTEVGHPLRARDTLLMVEGLRALGVGVDDRPDGDWLVTPPDSLRGPASVDCGLAGTVMRFLPPVAALAAGEIRFDGDPRARERPMRPLLTALRDLGVIVDDAGREALPFTVHGTGRVRGGTVEIDASGSSQFISAVLLAGCRYDAGVDVRSVGAALPSRPHLDMTVAMLAAAGVPVQQPEPGRWVVPPQRPRSGRLAAEPDVSNALPFAGAALVTRGRVRIIGWPTGSTYQPEQRARAVLGALGARLVEEDGALLVDGSSGIRGIDADLSAIGEMVPVVAALAALADGPTTIRGVAHLRGHETDRLAALAKEVNGLGGDVEELPDGLLVRPRPLHGGVFGTYADHRLATAGALLGLAVPGVQVEDIATTGKTLPGFVRLWTEMLAG
jgi:3-phosphoshikimate 1-carboxyvinyltransferase